MDERASQTKEFRQREQLFQSKKNRQQALLNQALAELRREERLRQKLTKKYEDNERNLEILENELRIATGTLGELLGVVKQVARDFEGHVSTSLVSAEIPGREKFLHQLATQQTIPTVKELRHLWFEIQREMTELGRVTQFPAEVVQLRGTKKTYRMTRVGGFNLVSQGQYFHYEGGSGPHITITELIRQPRRRFTRHIKHLERAKESSYTTFALDPSRGNLISILIRTPNLWEKLKQGGIIGFVIIGILILGLILFVERWKVFKREGDKLHAQLKDMQNPHANNPIGEMLLVCQKNKAMNTESLELKLNEIVIKYLPRLERGISTIKIFIALAPLLGLLGTVTGMIVTFQSITLFGTGDPKLMAGGISQALVTTVLGLCCAVPLMLCHNFISIRCQNLMQILEEQVTRLLAHRADNTADNNRSEK